jgi:hypothetical protein
MIVPLLLLAAVGMAQVSNGSDGVLNITTSGDFDPVALGKDLDGDNVYHFTTINISGGVTVRLRASKMRNTGPVIWLATGAVTINGLLIVSGDTGHPDSQAFSLRTPSDPGPGGYPGGAGAKPGANAQRGAGPGGGAAATNSYGCAAGHVAAGTLPARCTGGGISYGNALLQPLVGGSGGSGGGPSGSWTGSGGGAGGGAIRIYSPVSITVTANSGGVYSDGGLGGPATGGYYGGPGSGGAIHLVAPTVTLNASGGCFCARGQSNSINESSSAGRIRIDGALSVPQGSVIPSPLVGPYVVPSLPSPNPTVVVTSVNGIAVPANPQNSYTVPDISINTGTPVPINIAATNIPVATVVTLYISTDLVAADQAVATSPLAGSLANSTATASVTLPTGVSRIFVRAVW